MTDQEINEAVYKKLGWEQTPQTFIPNYCHSIEAVWEILINCDNWSLYCSGIKVEASLSKNYDEAFAEDEIASMAICLAFLKLP